jgi:hypothetical protein
MDLPLQLAAEVERNVLAALVEDIGGGDLTALLTSAARRSRHRHQPGGRRAGRHRLVRCLLPQARSAGRNPLERRDGDVVARRPDAVRNRGDTRALLTAERAALNFLQLLSGTATVDAALRRSRGRHRRAHRRHPQDPARPAPGAEIRGHLRRRPQPSPRPLRRHPDQGKPHHGGGRRHGGTGAGARPGPRRTSSSRSRWKPWSNSPRRSTPAPA